MAAAFHGNGSMNTPSLVESADTGPFFHNNSAETIEDAVRFYTTRTFSSDDPFQLNGAQLNQLAAFLRVLNALENARNVDLLARDAQRQQQGRAGPTIDVVIADTADAIEVLTEGPIDLHPDAVELLDQALGLAEDAARHRSGRHAQPIVGPGPGSDAASPGPDPAGAAGGGGS